MSDTVRVEFGYQNFANYRRLAYKWWYALAEFVDNSTQSYFDHREALNEQLQNEEERFRVSIATGKDIIRVSDNAFGMTLEDLRQALQVGVPPKDSSGRCRYGLGMKTAACWIGNQWKIVTTALGDCHEVTLTVNVDEIARGKVDLPFVVNEVEPGSHHTIIASSAESVGELWFG